MSTPEPVHQKPHHTPTPITGGESLSPPVIGGSGARIVQRQDDPTSLEYLAARANRYQAASRILGWQFLLILSTVLAALLKPHVTELHSTSLAASLSLLVDFWIVGALFVELWLDEKQDRRRDEGAAIQEMFDRRLFFGRASPGEWAEDVPPECRRRWATDAKLDTPSDQQSNWRGWYPAAISALPLSVACLACQRTNAWWDKEQRSRYAALMFTMSGVLILVVLVLAIIPDLSRDVVRDEVLVWLPLPYWLMREGVRHRKAANTGRRIFDRATEAINYALTCTPAPRGDAVAAADDAEFLQRAESIQSALLRRRQESPIVPNRFYRWLRPSHEDAVSHGVEDVVRRWHGQE